MVTPEEGRDRFQKIVEVRKGRFSYDCLAGER